MNNKEIWKDVIGYEDLYQVSNHGNVKSFHKYLKGKLLKPGIDGSGYYHVIFCKNKKRKILKVHRLIAIHFVPNPDNKLEINHIDGDKSNNHVNNLEWCTRSENMKHAYNNGLNKNTRKAASMNNKKYHSKKVKCIETGIVYESTNEAERNTRINHSHISACCRGKLKSAGKKVINGELTKLTWKYI